MRNLFNQYDLDGNGEIDQDELYAIVDDMLHNKASSIYIVQVKTLPLKKNLIFKNGRSEELCADTPSLEMTANLAVQ